ncbi:glycosyltransferase [Mycobacterium sp. M23085]|uniref:glycosyltransferase n=1 Tax=Mycobacterium sp. M23085 TaxID=3378087 RepID=UPI003878305B
MIFVIMGMEVHPFDRLARAVDELARTGEMGEDFFVQLGTCRYQPLHARFERFLSFGDVCEQIRRASVAVTHAGAGSALVCIEQGKHPVLVPRRSSCGEHVDEHQLPFAEKLAAAGLATVVNEMRELPAAIAATRSRSAPADALGRARELTGWLEAYWRSLTCASGRHADGPAPRR